MKWLIIIALVLVIIIAITLIIGYLLPVKHTVQLSSTINAPVDSVWDRISHPGKFTQWRKDLKKVELVSPGEWIETSNHNDKIPFKIVESIPNQKLVGVINSKKLPYGGSWTYELKDNGTTTGITIIENGEVYNPFFRFMSKYIFGHTATIKSYLKHLEASFKP